jgi:ABC-type transport system involved in multi-copper enzyme maturation permease subunit
VTAELLIAGNFVREQRWPIIMLLLWVFISGFITTVGGMGVDDVLFFVKQQAVYGVAFSAFLAASAIQNERRSRRILAVLSKGVGRRQYLGGLLTGVMAAATVYCAAMGCVGTVMFRRAGLRQESLWLLLLVLLAACLLTATLAIFFATFLSALLATAATAVTLGAPVVAAQVAGPGWANSVLPVYRLMEVIMAMGGRRTLPDVWDMVAWAIVNALAVWLAASFVFSYRDIAVAIE